jgi:DNA-directed RNA polymerase subunit RPC12/RpoP
MIYFTCPNCSKHLQHPKPADTVACPQCGQRILVPLPAASNPTLLAKAEPPPRRIPEPTPMPDQADLADRAALLGLVKDEPEEKAPASVVRHFPRSVPEPSQQNLAPQIAALIPLFIIAFGIAAIAVVVLACMGLFLFPKTGGAWLEGIRGLEEKPPTSFQRP